MNRLIIILALALCWACSSQSEEELRGAVTVNITARLDPACHQSRTTAEETTTRCFLEILRNGVSEGVTQLQANGGENYSLSPTLYVGSEYKFYFWADPGEDYFSFDSQGDLSSVTMIEPAVAYWGSASLTPTDGNSSLIVTLNHAVAKISFVTSTAMQLSASEAGNTVSMTVPGMYPSINVHAVDDDTSESAVGTAASREFSTVLTTSVAASEAVLVAYGFVAKNNGNQSVVLQYGYAPSVTVSNVPISTNTHTQLLGDITNQALVGVTASIVTAWEDTSEDITWDEEEDLDGVDMGTGIIWATMNLGATAPEEYGNYYQWGAIEPVDVTNVPSYTLTPKWDSNGILTSEYDAAAQNSPWRMPTKEEYEDLFSNCTWVSSSLNGVSGYKVYDSSLENMIFFPQCGIYYPGSSFAGSYMYYWTSTYYGLYNGNEQAYVAYVFNNKTTKMVCENALPIRPVRDKN